MFKLFLIIYLLFFVYFPKFIFHFVAQVLCSHFPIKTKYISLKLPTFLGRVKIEM